MLDAFSLFFDTDRFLKRELTYSRETRPDAHRRTVIRDVADCQSSISFLPESYCSEVKREFDRLDQERPSAEAPNHGLPAGTRRDQGDVITSSLKSMVNGGYVRDNRGNSVKHLGFAAGSELTCANGHKVSYSKLQTALDMGPDFSAGKQAASVTYTADEEIVRLGEMTNPLQARCDKAAKDAKERS